MFSVTAVDIGLIVCGAIATGLLAVPSIRTALSTVCHYLNKPEMYRVGDHGVQIGQDILPVLLWLKASPGVTEMKVNRPQALDALYPHELAVGFTSSVDHVKELTKMIRVIENYTRTDIAWVETRWENETQVHILHFYNAESLKMFIERGPATNMKAAPKTA